MGDNQKNMIQSYKNGLDHNYSKYRKYKKAMASAKTNAATLKLQLEANIKTNNESIKEKRATMKAIDESIAIQKPELSKLNQQLDDLSSEILSENEIYDNNIKLIDDDSRKDLFKKVDKEIKGEVLEITRDVVELTKLCGNVNFAAITAAAGNGQVKQLTTLLRGVQPRLGK